MTRDIDPPLQLVAAERARVADLMRGGAVTVHADASLYQLIDLWLAKDLSRIPVIDDHGVVVGIVTKTDLVVYQHGCREADADGRPSGDGVTTRVRDIMTPIAFSVSPTTKLGDAARRMLSDHFHLLPVVRDTGELVGVLSMTDIVAWIAGIRMPAH